MARRKKPVIVILLPLLVSTLTLAAFFYMIYKDGHIWEYLGFVETPINGKSQITSQSLQTADNPSVSIDRATIPAKDDLRSTLKTRSSLVPGIYWPLTPSGFIPDTGYPMYSPLLEVIRAWNPDIPDKPEKFVETLYHFNFSDPAERLVAEQFRDAELPFKLYAVPQVDALAEKWSDNYLLHNLETSHNTRVEKAESNHFMFWTEKHHLPDNWKQPTEVVDMKFSKWLALAKQADTEKLSNETTHYYFMTHAAPGDRGRTFVARDLNFFATNQENFFITNVGANKGIQCRFGMRGVIAATHYDGGKNMVAMIKGNKRYVLTPPRTCSQLGIIADPKHPSYRHSVIDWSDEDQARSRGFDRVDAIDTIVRTGEVLYIPSYWFHYIVSMDYSIQCNSRSGSPPNGEGQEDIEKCTGVSMHNLRHEKAKKKNKKGLVAA